MRRPLPLAVASLAAVALLVLAPGGAARAQEGEAPKPTAPDAPPAAPALPKALANGGFEEGELGKAPPGWSVPTPDFRVVVTDETALDGRHVALVEGKGGERTPFGNIMQAIDATDYRGKWVKLRAAVRVEPATREDAALLWMRVDRPGGERGFFENMGDRPIVRGHWRYYEIEGDVADDAVAINVGLMLSRRGRAFVDEVSITVTGDVERPEPQAAAPLDDAGLANLVAFAKLYGYVRWFHPTAAVEDADWELIAAEGVRAVEDAADPGVLVTRLEELFAPLAPSMQVFVKSRKPPVPVSLMPPEQTGGLRVVVWRHHGVGTGMPDSIYSSARYEAQAPEGKVPDGVAAPWKPYTADLGEFVACRVPVALFADETGLLPRARAAAPKSAGELRRERLALVQDGGDRATRLADVIIAWNIFQHFYPYFDVVETDWDAALTDALKSAATDEGERAFLDTLRRLVARLHDGHGNVVHPCEDRSAHLPIAWDWVEGKLVVTRVADGVEGIARGDVVTAIDGAPAADAIAAAEALISGATPQWLRWRALGDLLGGAPGSSVTLALAPPEGDATTVTLTRAKGPRLAEERPARVAEPQPGIQYVDIDRVKPADLAAALPALKDARGIVFDLRGYPGEVTTQQVLCHLTELAVNSARWNVPVSKQPDRTDVVFSPSDWPVVPKPPKLAARIVFVTDGRAISAAETLLGIVEAHKLGAIVGGPTAGTNGNINPFVLPGGYTVVYTGMKVLKQDGGRHHGVGIQPTVPTSRTIAGVIAGRDELLEKAIEVAGGAGK